MTYDKILSDIQKKIFSPVYFFTGEEAYFIDTLADLLENSVLEPAEKEFNQTVVYGSELNVGSLLDLARRYPMFSNYQVILVREAQDIKEIETLASYIEKPVPTTILVFCYKYKKLDKRKTFAKILEKNAVFFESKKLYDNQVPDWISQYVRSKAYSLDPRAAQLLTDHVGSDLGRLVQEIHKLMVNITAGSSITIEHIEKFIGISKEFNVFELQKAVGDRNIFRTNQIAYYMASNPKENPIQKIIPILYSYFSKLLIYHTLPDKSRTAVASALGVNPFFVPDYQKSAQQYPFGKITSIISILREYDLRSKGVNNDSTEDSELIREMLYKILH